ncbi:hypothetical protein ACCS96_27090 [Rhizobium ruizarguesonis]
MIGIEGKASYRGLSVARAQMIESISRWSQKRFRNMNYYFPPQFADRGENLMKYALTWPICELLLVTRPIK